MAANSLDRRDLLKLLTATPFAVSLQLSAAEPGAPLYFTAAEFKLLDHLTDLVIPRDSHSPGAHDAGVAAYLDRTAAEAFLPEDKESWRKGLAEIDRLSVEKFQQPFLQIDRAQQTSLLRTLAEKEFNPQTDGEKFFGQLKNSTVFAYYSSKIGIHEEMQYKGNVPIQQFAGYDAV